MGLSTIKKPVVARGSRALIWIRDFPADPRSRAAEANADMIKVNPLLREACYARSIRRAPGGTTAMAYYRLYFMDPRSGHIAAFESIEAPDDEAAIATADAHRGWQVLELWCEARKVRRFEAKAAPPVTPD